MLVTTFRVVLKIEWTIHLERLEHFSLQSKHYVRMSYCNRLLFKRLQLVPSLFRCSLPSDCTATPIKEWTPSPHALELGLTLPLALVSIGGVGTLLHIGLKSTQTFLPPWEGTKCGQQEDQSLHRPESTQPKLRLQRPDRATALSTDACERPEKSTRILQLNPV